MAAVLDVSTRTVRRLIKRGELVTYRINRQLRVDAESVTRLLETSLIGASRRTVPCRSESTPSVNPTSFVAGERTSSGPAGSTGREVSLGTANRIEAQQKLDELTHQPRTEAAPQNTAELKNALRQLKYRS